jgi:hypothetical protein
LKASAIQYTGSAAAAVHQPCGRSTADIEPSTSEATAEPERSS